MRILKIRGEGIKTIEIEAPLKLEILDLCSSLMEGNSELKNITIANSKIAMSQRQNCAKTRNAAKLEKLEISGSDIFLDGEELDRNEMMSFAVSEIGSIVLDDVALYNTTGVAFEGHGDRVFLKNVALPMRANVQCIAATQIEPGKLCHINAPRDEDTKVYPDDEFPEEFTPTRSGASKAEFVMTNKFIQTILLGFIVKLGQL